MIRLDVDKYIGLPFVDGGRDLDGLDCWGLVSLIYKDVLDLEIPNYEISALDTDKVCEAMSWGRDNDGWMEVAKGEYRPGDLVALAMHLKYPDMINHVGVYVGGGSFIHTQQKTGAIISPMYHILYEKRVKGVYRYG
jgi:cell wall-associated NlpC family hydrolase